MYSDARYAVRNDCCERIFAIFQNPKVHFNEKLWKLVYDGFISTIFDGPMKSGVESINELMSAPTAEDAVIRLGNARENKKAYLQTTGALVMYSIVRLYVERRDQVGFLLTEFFALMQNAMKQSILSLARIGVFCLKQMMLEGAKSYDEAMWDVMLNELEVAFKNSMPDDVVLNARKKLHLIYDKNLRAGGVAPKVGKWVRTPCGTGKLVKVDDICATVELIYGNAYFHKLSEVEDLEKLKKESAKVVKKEKEEKRKRRDSESESSESSDSEDVVEEVVEDESIKLETTDTRSLDIDEVMAHTKTIVQSDLAALVSEVVDLIYASFTFEQVKRMLGLMQSVSDMTRDFHQDMELREMEKKLGFPKEGDMLPTLIYEQVAVETSIIHVLFVLYMDEKAPERHEYANADLLERMKNYLAEYVEIEKEAHVSEDEKVKKEKERVAVASVPLITEIVNGMDKTPFDKFVAYSATFYPLFVSMIEFSGSEVRAALAKIFRDKIGKMLFP